MMGRVVGVIGSGIVALVGLFMFADVHEYVNTHLPAGSVLMGYPEVIASGLIVGLGFLTAVSVVRLLGG